MSGDPAYLKALKGEMPIMKMGWFQSYKKAFIDTGRFTPIVHIITGVMIGGYLLEFATHLRRETPPREPPIPRAAPPQRGTAAAPFSAMRHPPPCHPSAWSTPRC